MLNKFKKQKFVTIALVALVSLTACDANSQNGTFTSDDSFNLVSEENVEDEVSVQNSSAWGLKIMAVNSKPSLPAVALQPGSNLITGQDLQASTSRTPQYQTGTISGRLAEIRFSPISAKWNFSDSVRLSGFEISRNFTAAGAFTVQLVVTYDVSYRFNSSESWRSDCADTTSTSQLIAISVAQSTPQIDPTNPPDSPEPPELAQVALRLVATDCSASPEAPGC